MKKQTLNIVVDNYFDDSYKSFFESFFNLTITLMKDVQSDYIKDFDFAVFTGGSDVNPELYEQKKGKYTQINNERDIEEVSFFKRCKYIPKLGICRGAQFLTVMSGGQLIQHVEGHNNGHHNISIFHMDQEYGNYKMSSTHHQMMYPYNLLKGSYKIIGWSTKYLGNTYLDGNDKQIDLPNYFLEPEIVYYTHSKSLCIQGHPEDVLLPDSTKRLCIDLIKDILILNNNKL